MCIEIANLALHSPNDNSQNMKFFFLIFLLIITLSSNMNAQDVLKLEEGMEPGIGKLSDLSWMTGYWKGTGLGGDCDELWLPAVDNSMQGIFRFSKEGILNFSEYMLIVEENNSLTIKLKHFSRTLEPWEEKDKWVSFRLVKIEGQTAYFSGLTYRRENDVLTVSLRMKKNEETWTEEFRFVKSEL